MKSKVTIVGAGPVGCLWAILLKKRGYDVTVYERRADIRKISAQDDRSINLVVTSRGLNGLSKAGILDDVIRLSVPIFGRMIHSKAGGQTFQPYGNSTECNFSISRTELNKFLLTAAEKSGVEFNFEHPLKSIDFDKKTLTFEGSSTDTTSPAGEVHFDLLFGTDGSGSRVRKLLCEKYPTEFSEKVEWLEADYKELFLPANAAVEKNALHIWPRGSHMMMALANLDGSFTVTLYMPKDAFKCDETKLFHDEFPDAIPLMPTYSADYRQNPQSRLGTVRTSKWRHGDSVALMGDAAHAILPFFGQGMNCGFEDCTRFLEILDQTRSANSDNWPLALKKFEEVQKPNANAIADMAIENWTEMRDRVGDLKFLLRKKVESLLEREFPSIFKSRYGMVTYTLIPYSVAYQAGRIQDRILTELCSEIESIDRVDLKKAKALLDSELAPFVQKNRLKLETDPLVSETRQRFS